MDLEKILGEINLKLANIEDRLTELEKIKEENLILDSRLNTDEIISRNYRLHTSALNEFDRVKRNNKLKHLNTQELLSQALLDFAEKHDVDKNKR